MERVRIEGLEEGGRGDAARRILETEGIALVAVGAQACVRSIYFVAESLGRTHRLFYRGLTSRDYSLGRQERAIRECVQEALSCPSVRGIIIYASCLDILAGLDPEEILSGLSNPKGIPVDILYRGPLTRRREPPAKALERIWRSWGIQEGEQLQEREQFQDGKQIQEGEQLQEREQFQDGKQFLKEEAHGETKGTGKEPEAPLFEKIAESLEAVDCDLLLLTPGGCKSCMSLQNRETFKRVKNTRLSEEALYQGCLEELVEPILEAFPKKRPLVILETPVMDAVGFDYEELCRRLGERGKKAVRMQKIAADGNSGESFGGTNSASDTPGQSSDSSA